MCPRHFLIATILALASAASAQAQYAPGLYVANGGGRQLLAIPINSDTGAAGNPQALITEGSAINAVALKSDGALVYATPGQIRQIGLTSAVASVTDVRTLAYSAYDCLFYNRAGGVNSVACGNPGSSSGSGVKGLDFDIAGRILAVSGNTIIRILLSSTGQKSVDPAWTPIVVSAVPTGIAVAPGEGNNLKRGDFAVATGNSVTLYKIQGDKTYVATTYASVPVGQTINAVKFDNDNHLYIAAGTGTAGTNTPNGRVYRVDTAGTAIPVLVLPKGVQGKYWPAVDLELDPSARVMSVLPISPSNLPGNPPQTFKFDLGRTTLDITATVLASCELQVSARTALNTPTPYDQALFSWNPFLGDGGLPTIYHITSLAKNAQNVSVEVPAANCVDTSDVTFFFGAMLSKSNLAIVRCRQGDTPSCREVTLAAYHKTGPIDGDDGGRGSADGWSDWHLLERRETAQAGLSRVCAVAPPLQLGSSATVNEGSVRFAVQIAAPGYSCESGMLLTDPTAKILISAAQVGSAHAYQSHVISPSGQSGEPPFLTNAGPWWEFELQTWGMEGTIEVTLLGLEGVRFAVPQTVYFDMRKAAKK